MRKILGLCAAVFVFGWAYSAAAWPGPVRLVLGDDNPTPATVGSGAAADATSASEWNALCLSHRDDPQQVAGLAEARGWMVAPSGLAPPMRNVIGAPRIWMRSSAGGLKFLVLGRISGSLMDDNQKFTGRFCAVGVMPAEADLQQDVAALVPIPPNPSGAKPGRVTYVYRHTPQGLAPILGDLKDPETAKAIQSSDVDIVQVGSTAKMAVILLLTPDGP